MTRGGETGGGAGGGAGANAREMAVDHVSVSTAVKSGVIPHRGQRSPVFSLSPCWWSRCLLAGGPSRRMAAAPEGAKRLSLLATGSFFGIAAGFTAIDVPAWLALCRTPPENGGGRLAALHSFRYSFYSAAKLQACLALVGSSSSLYAWCAERVPSRGPRSCSTSDGSSSFLPARESALFLFRPVCRWRSGKDGYLLSSLLLLQAFPVTLVGLMPINRILLTEKVRSRARGVDRVWILAAG